MGMCVCASRGRGRKNNDARVCLCVRTPTTNCTNIIYHYCREQQAGYIFIMRYCQIVKGEEFSSYGQV